MAWQRMCQLTFATFIGHMYYSPTCISIVIGWLCLGEETYVLSQTKLTKNSKEDVDVFRCWPIYD